MSLEKKNHVSESTIAFIDNELEGIQETLSSAEITVIIEIIIMCFVAPALISFGISEVMRKANIIKAGDLSLKDIN